MAYKKIYTIKELREEIHQFLKDNGSSDLLTLADSSNIDRLINNIKIFVQKNYRGLSTSQLRVVYDKIPEDGDIKNINFRSFLAFKIVSQRDDNAKRILLLIEELVNTSDTPEQLVGFKSLVETIVSYHNYYNTGKARLEKKLLPEAKNAFLDLKYPLCFLEMEKSNELGQVFTKLKSFLAKNAKGITTHQLRKIYNRVKANNDINKLKLLRPLFANTIARQKGNDKAQRIMLLIDNVIKTAQSCQLEGVKKWMEVLVAFHKYYNEIYPKKEEQMLADIKAFFEPIRRTEILNRKKIDKYPFIENRLKAFIKNHYQFLPSVQIRKLQDFVRDSKTPMEIQMLRPQICYAIARQSKIKAQKLLLLIDVLAGSVNEDTVDDFKDFLEDLIAYHEFFEATKGLGIEI